MSFWRIGARLTRIDSGSRAGHDEQFYLWRNVAGITFAYYETIGGAVEPARRRWGSGMHVR